MKKVKLGEIAIITSGSTPSRKNPSFWEGDIPWVKTGNLIHTTITIDDIDEKITQKALDSTSLRLVPAGTIIMAMYGQGKTRGQVGILGIDATINQACAAFSLNGGISRDFLFQQLRYRYNEIRNLSNTGSQENLNADIIRSIRIPLPNLREQNKTASLLGTWDSAIEKTERLIVAKKKQLSWIRSQYFTGKRCIRAFTKPWTLSPLSSALAIRGETSQGKEEVFSVSVHKGLVNQIDHLGRNFAAKDTSRYSRVESGDLVYTRSPTGDFPYGIIKQSAVDIPVIVSPLYGVFKPKTLEIGAFLDFFFESSINARNYLHPLIQKGAKNTINITDESFLKGNLNLPSDDKELHSLIEIIRSAKEEVRILQSVVDNLVSQKSFLMSKLLTGEWEAPSIGAEAR